MKRTFLFVLLLSVVTVAFCGLVYAGPKVAIVKSDNHEVVGEGYKFDIRFIHPYDLDKGVTKDIMYMHAEWTPESEAAIEKLVRQAIELAGDWPVKKGDTVFIKPNFVCDVIHMLVNNKSTVEELQSVHTDPRVARAIAIVALESGAKKVMFGDLPAHGDSYATAKSWGYEAMAQALEKSYPGRVELIDMKAGPYHFCKPEHTGGLALKEYAIPDVLINADVVISAPVMKTHDITGMTGALKNIGIGSPHPNVYGQFKMGLPHQRLSEVITDVCDIVGIDYVVVDAIWAMEERGPLYGKPIAMDMIIAGKDPVAVDYVTTECMGMNGEIIGTTRMAQEYGLGTYAGVEVVGTPVHLAMKHFDPVPRDKRFPSYYAQNVGW